MKIVFYYLTALSFIICFAYCSSSKKIASIPAPPLLKTTYVSNVQSIVAQKCSPCHFPEKGGNKAPLNTKASLAEEIDNVISRIEMHPGDNGFMPFRQQRLSDSLINVFKKWKADGLVEK